MPFHRLLVFEQIVAQVKEALLLIACVEIIGRDAVVDEFPDVLREAAPEVEKCVLRLGLLEEGEDTRVAGLGGYGELEEPKPADARIWSPGPRPLSLHVCALVAKICITRRFYKTDDFEHVRVDRFRGNVAVVLQELAACRAQIFELFVVPRDFFAILVGFGFIVCLVRGRRHCVIQGSCIWSRNETEK